jgi:serine protease AprX
MTSDPVRDRIEEIFYGKSEQQRRFTQDFPVLPDVWLEYARPSSLRVPLLLTPHFDYDAPTLARALRERLTIEIPPGSKKRWSREHPELPGPRILFNQSVVLACLSFREMMRGAMPLTDWWKNVINPIESLWQYDALMKFAQWVNTYETGRPSEYGITDPKLIKKLIKVIAYIECARTAPETASPDSNLESLTDVEMTQFARVFEGLPDPGEHSGMLWSISLNREASTSVWRSRMTVKADAAARLFDTRTSGIRWAVLDTGIDARHKAFRKRDENGKPKDHDPNAKEDGLNSRVLRTYDFLRITELLDPDTDIPYEGNVAATMDSAKFQELKEDLQSNLLHGRSVDWDLLEPFLRVPHTVDGYEAPETDSHGTHVAGILAADWPEAKDETPLKEPLRGICPELEIYDIRVLPHKRAKDPTEKPKKSDEFTIIAALQFIRHLNAHKDVMVIHGVNLSLSVPHDVANFACGRTPVCEECERVVNNGVVVVTAAGNRGFIKLPAAEGGALGDYRYISITDPGNADGVITVGSTHRLMPHNYGVSYFSSRGPTGDGRTKPDLVAPGERIDSCSLNGYYETMDGTSMAAPHVSGAAALLIGRHRELMGQPRRVKEILCRSATDLGREPRFQGAGLVDVLRALQTV